MDSPTLDEFQILTAADLGDLEFFQKLEEKTPDKEELRLKCERAKNCRGSTAIHFAAKKGRLEICKFLIENVGVDINIESENGNRALMIAVHQGHKELVEYLISRGANINACNHEMTTALHFAVIQKNTEFIQVLVSNGANVKAVTKGKSAIQMAAINAHVESIQLLLDNGAEPNCNAMVSAIKQRSPECLELLLKAGADPNVDGLDKSPLAYAVESGELQVIKLLLEAGANPNAVCRNGLKAIEHAARAEKREAVEFLFPSTEKMRYIRNWNVDGIMVYHSGFSMI